MCVYWLHLLLYFKSSELKLLKFPLGHLFIVAEQCVCACVCENDNNNNTHMHLKCKFLMLCVYDISVCRLVM